MSREGHREKHMKKKITVLTLGAMLFALCFSAQAQETKKIPRIGFLTNTKLENPSIEPFRRGLQDLGYIEGKNIRVEYRYFETKREVIPALVAELVQMNIDVLVDWRAAGYSCRAGRLRKQFPLSW